MKLFSKLEILLEKISSMKHFAFVWSSIFILIFSTAFYFIFLDAFAIRDQLRNDFNQQQLILAKQSSERIGDFFDNLIVQLNYLSWSSSKDTIFSKESMKLFYNQYSKTGLIGLSLLNSVTGRVIFSKGYEEVSIYHSHDNLDTELKLSDLHIIKDKKRNKIYSNIFIMTSGENLFCVSFDIELLLKNIVGEIRSGKTGYAWVINNRFIALYHPDKNFIGRDIFSARHKKKPYVNFSKINDIMKEKMSKGEQGTGEYESWWHRNLKGKILKLIAFYPIKNKILGENTIWSVAVVAPISEVSNAVEKSYFRHYIAEAFIILGMFLFVVLVVSYQKRISASLKEKVNVQKEYITSILENSMDAIIFTDTNDLVFVWNKGAERIFGYKSEEMLGNNFIKLLPEDLTAEGELSKINNIVYEKGFITNYITQRKTKDERIINVNITKTLIKSDDDSVIGHSIIVRDETEKQELEQRIYNTEKLASIGTLAAGVAHEINNPLTVILGYTDLLIESLDKSSEFYADIKIIDKNANNAKKIVENLLGFARITEGLEDNIDVNHSIRTVISIVNNTLFTSNINISLNLAEELPYAKGDVREFEQVIFNLINNSVAALKNTNDALITIRSYLKNEKVLIEIIDNGIGIPKKIKNRIFDPFFTTKKVGEGTGLGLSLCYGILSKFDGRISFKSRTKEDFPDKDSGTIFLIELSILNV